MSALLRAIEVQVPTVDLEAARFLVDVLSPFAEAMPDRLRFYSSNEGYLPSVELHFEANNHATVRFVLDSGAIGIDIANATGLYRRSPHAYRPLELIHVRERLAKLSLSMLDHIGVNVPWFSGMHPEILRLRNQLFAGHRTQ